MLALRKDMGAKKVTMENFKDALKKVRASVSEDVERTYRELQDKFRSAAGKQIQDEKPSYYG